MLAAQDQWFKSDDQFIGSYFQKAHSDLLSPENQEIWSSEEKLKNLKRLYELAKAQDQPKKFQQEFLIEILKLGPKVNDYDEKLFTEYLETVQDL